MALSIVQLTGRSDFLAGVGGGRHASESSDINGPWEAVEGEPVAEGGVVSLDLPADQAQGFYRAVSI